MPEIQNECKRCHQQFTHEISQFEAAFSLRKIPIPQLCPSCVEATKDHLSEWVKPPSNQRILMETLEHRF
jgi:hypothetical protein